MRKSKQFNSMPVISLEEGQQIGTIKGLVVDPAQKRVAALIIEQKGWFQEQKFIPYSNVHSVGDDALTIKRGVMVQRGSSLPEIINLVKNPVSINGARIVTENGSMLGEVDDYYVSLATGELVGMEFSGSYISGLFNGKAFLDIDHVHTIGKEMIICSDQALESAIKLDGGLQDRLRSIKDATGGLLESTLEKTRGLGSSMNKSIGMLKRNKQEEHDDNDTKEKKPADSPEPQDNMEKKE